ncbi:MAG TPA: outer membrane protein assembly factor BamE [Devosia sp.]|nr:outer membrane protein assembly factor BamE [Devosia sp.]
MPSPVATRRFGALLVSLGFALSLSACATGFEGFTQQRVEGYDISQDALAQIRPGQSQALVTTVLGSPQLTNDFGQESAYYYVSTRVTETALGTTSINSRTVLAVYFDKNKKVKDRAVYTLKDGKPVAIEQRRTPSYGEDRTFIQSILSSFSSASPA